jgi:hypothetical protein
MGGSDAINSAGSTEETQPHPALVSWAPLRGGTNPKAATVVCCSAWSSLSCRAAGAAPRISRRRRRRKERRSGFDRVANCGRSSTDTQIDEVPRAELARCKTAVRWGERTAHLYAALS